MPNRMLAAIIAAWFILSASPRVQTAATTPGEPSSGSISVASDPLDATVFIDGAPAGRTPLTVERIQAGDHRVRIVKDGYLENSRIVAITAGKTTDLRLRLTPKGSATEIAPDQTGGGLSSGPPPGSKRKWLYIGAAGGAAAATAVVLATRNHAPTLGTLSVSPTGGLAAATPFAFSAPNASDPDSDPLTYSWEFGDGTSSKEQAPRHVYNSAGSFSVRCTISDGKQSDTSTIPTVTVRTLTGTWRGVLDDVQVTFGITHSGGALSGTVVDVFASGSIAGFVATSPPLVRFTVLQTGFFPYTYTADPNADVTTLTGVLNGSGYSNKAFTIMRQ
jgi:PEGA domain-containing protein/PKD domain-containing protein